MSTTSSLLITVVLLMEVISFICMFAFGFVGVSQSLWLKETRGEELVFRQPASLAAFGFSFFLFLMLFPVFLFVNVSNQPAGVVEAAWFFGSIAIGPLLLLSPQELHINTGDRTLWWEKGWLWRHRRTGTLDDMAGVCTTRKSVMLVFKKRKFIGYGLTLGGYGGVVTAEDMAETLGLPVVASPW